MRCYLAVLVSLSACASWGCGGSDENAARSNANGGSGAQSSGGSDLGGRSGAGGTVAGDAGTGGDSTSGKAGAANAGGGAGGIGGGGGNGGAGGNAKTVTLKVQTLNNPSMFSTTLAAQDILASGADIVGLQETTPAEAAAIRAELGEPWAFVQEDHDNTHAIVSKLPILQRIGVTQETRGGIGASIEVEPGLYVHLFDSHGMWTPYGPYQLGLDHMSVDDVVKSEEAVRMPGVRELLELAAPYIQSSETTFLVGDFNAPSHFDYVGVPWPTSLAPLEAGLIDSYHELHADNPKKSACEFAIDDPGVTWCQSSQYEPDGCFDRIDFIYYSDKDARPVESHTINAKASDHRSVITTFELTVPVRTQQARPELPVPDAELVSRHALLTWVPGLDAIAEDLLIGSVTPSETVKAAGSGHYLTKLLAPSTTYAWRVDTTNPSGTVSSEVRKFTTRSSAGLEPDAHSYAPNAAITVQFDGANQPKDWIGLDASAVAYGPKAPATWKYLNGSGTAPQNTVPSGTISLTAPATPGSYALRFFDNDGYTVEDEVTILVE